VRQIVTYGNDVLRKKAESVNEIDQKTKDLVADMIATLKDAGGLGLAAPQVGESKRIFIVDLSPVDLTEDVRVFINPEIIGASGEITMEEGCLSFPGIFQKLTRPERVRIKAFDLTGNEFELEADGVLARAILHEYDHLDGKLFIDYLSSVSRALLSGKLRRLAAAS
jgi:peptide deformylase